MKTSLGRRVAGVFVSVLIGVGVLGPAQAASADPICVDAPVNNENGEPIAWVCVEIDQSDPRVQGSAAVTGTVGTSVTVSPEGRILDWVRVCMMFPPPTSDLPPESFCMLSE